MYRPVKTEEDTPLAYGSPATDDGYWQFEKIDDTPVSDVERVCVCARE